MAVEGRMKFGTATALTHTFGGLTSSTVGVGEQTAIVTGNIYPMIFLLIRIKLGSGYTANKAIYPHLIRSDGTRRDDEAASTAGALTIVNSMPLAAIRCPSGLPSNFATKGYIIYDPGPEWGIAIYHDTVAALDATDGNHTLYYQGGLIEQVTV